MQPPLRILCSLEHNLPLAKGPNWQGLPPHHNFRDYLNACHVRIALDYGYRCSQVYNTPSRRTDSLHRRLFHRTHQHRNDYLPSDADV